MQCRLSQGVQETLAHCKGQETLDHQKSLFLLVGFVGVVEFVVEILEHCVENCMENCFEDLTGKHTENCTVVCIENCSEHCTEVEKIGTENCSRNRSGGEESTVHDAFSKCFYKNLGRVLWCTCFLQF